jgi:hypothetical protein
MDQDLLHKIIKNQELMQRNMSKVMDDTGTIKRAIYGDPDNLVSGLIHRQVEDENRIKKLEDIKKKFVWVAGGFIIAFEVVKAFIFRT